MTLPPVTLAQVASFGVGLVVGLIAVTIFAVILKRYEEKYPKEAIKALWALVGLVLIGGGADYAVLDLILKANAIFFYLGGFVATFLPFGLVTVISWIRK